MKTEDACAPDLAVRDRYRILCALSIDTMPGLSANEARLCHEILLRAARTADAAADVAHTLRQGALYEDLLDYLETCLACVRACGSESEQ